MPWHPSIPSIPSPHPSTCTITSPQQASDKAAGKADSRIWPTLTTPAWARSQPRLLRHESVGRSISILMSHPASSCLGIYSSSHLQSLLSHKQCINCNESDSHIKKEAGNSLMQQTQRCHVLCGVRTELPPTSCVIRDADCDYE